MSQKEQQEYIVNNEQDMQHLVSVVLQSLVSRTTTQASVLALNGELGSGKTTFTKALAKELGVEEPVTSPTFVIQKSYDLPTSVKARGFTKLIHIDAYRLESWADTKVLGLATTMADKSNLVVIEWAENIKEALPEGVINIDFKYVDDTTRKVIFNGTM